MVIYIILKPMQEISPALAINNQAEVGISVFIRIGLIKGG